MRPIKPLVAVSALVVAIFGEQWLRALRCDDNLLGVFLNDRISEKRLAPVTDFPGRRRLAIKVIK